MCQKSSVIKNPYTDNPEDMNFDALEKLLKENAKHISIVRLHGGEPLHYEKIIRLIDLLDQLKMKYALITNGSLLTSEISKKLMKNCIEISISIDSADNQKYSEIREPGKLDTVTNNINYLNQLKKENKSRTPIINLAATIFSFNISGLPELINYCQALSISSISVSEGAYYNTPKVRDEHLIKHYPKEIPLAVNKAKRIAKESGIKFRLTSPILNSNSGFDTNYIKPHITKCINFYIYAVISPSLDVASCPLSDNIGNISTVPLEDIWNGKEYGFVEARDRLKSKKLPDSCRFCNDVNTRTLEDNQVYSYTILQKERYG